MHKVLYHAGDVVAGVLYCLCWISGRGRTEPR